MICIQIAGTIFGFRRADALTVGDRSADFQVSSDNADWNCSFEPADKLDVPGTCIYRTPFLEAYETPAGSVLRKYLDPLEGGCGVTVVLGDAATKTMTVKCSEQTYRSFFGTVEHCVNFMGIEWMLMQERKLFLHASCIDTSLGGILFTGPSGIGKSTQADLWCRYQGAELINGDKTILVKQQDGWYGWGSLYAGSSNCFRNQSVKVRAIVVLKQADACSLRRPDQRYTFRKILSQLTVNSWDREFMQRGIETASALTAELPVYELACTPTQDAVKLLWNELEKTGGAHG